MLTAEQLNHYRTHGYVVPDYWLGDEVLVSIRTDHDRLIAQHPEFRDYCPTLLAYDLTFLNYARIPDILDMVEQILGADFALWNSSLFAKPAGNGQATPWHQDAEYWPIRPIATCTVWVAVDDANTGNGCLRVIPGSHKSEVPLQHHTNSDPDLTLNQELLPTEFDETQAVDLVLSAGQISLHDVRLVHGSEPNRSDQSRRGMTLRYMPLTSVFDRSIEITKINNKNIPKNIFSERTLYLMRGRDQTGVNDFRMRQ